MHCKGNTIEDGRIDKGYIQSTSKTISNGICHIFVIKNNKNIVKTIFLTD